MIYKYIDRWGLNILRDKRIKITHPKNFNDPFEFLPRMSSTVTKAQVEAKLSDPNFLDNFYKIEHTAGRVSSRAEFDMRLQHKRVNILDALYKTYTGNTYSPENFKEAAGRRFGVTCFANIPDDILMWSHYADKHQGMVIGIDEATFGPLLYPVEYSMNRQEYHPVFNAYDRGDYIKRTLQRKSTHWAYEREMRVIIPWSLCVQDGSMNFCPIKALDIKEVILGCKSPPSLEDDVRKLRVNELAHISLIKLKIHSDEFRLESDTLK